MNAYPSPLTRPRQSAEERPGVRARSRAWTRNPIAPGRCPTNRSAERRGAVGTQRPLNAERTPGGQTPTNRNEDREGVVRTCPKRNAERGRGGPDLPAAQCSSVEVGSRPPPHRNFVSPWGGPN